MSHLELEHHVKLTVTSTNTQLLDNLEAELPADDAGEVGPEYDGPNRTTDAEDLADGEERLTARVTLRTTHTENDDVQQYAETYATNLYDELTALDFGSAEYEARHYLSPTGGVTASEVREYYEENEDEQPVDEDGEQFVPNSWDPSRHIVSEVSSNT